MPANGSQITSPMFQSTRPQGARCKPLGFSNESSIVSIHAPTRGAIKSMRLIKTSNCAFQSTRPQGARFDATEGVPLHDRVSIHAPTRGAMILTWVEYGHLPSRFNPRAHKGRDVISQHLFAVLESVSIHAPTRGAIRRLMMLIRILSGFNPRAHKGRDLSWHGGHLGLVLRFNPRAHKGRDLIVG